MRSYNPTNSRRRLATILAGSFISAICWLPGSIPLYGQAASRAEEIEQRRTDKKAFLWPERTSGITKQVDRFSERGLLEGARSGKGTSGFQVVLGGMRSGNGTTFGIGYRRVGLWGDRFGFRGTARGTIRQAYMFDLELDFSSLRSERSEVRLYAKYENSPMMDYYGPGPDSSKDDRTSYRLEDGSVDLEGRFRVWKGIHAGGSVGGYFPNTGRGKRNGVPSTEEIFDPTVTPGLGDQGMFFRVGALLQYDYRDLPSGPRTGGNYYSKYTHYWDKTLGRHDFNYLDSAVEQYIPYWNKTRVIAIRLASVLSWTREYQTVPFYLEPWLGGNEYLRGFARYRYYGQNALLLSVEHRWHLFSGGYGALFFETGKVAAKPSELDFSNLQYTGGIGLRFTIRDAVIMRIDNAFSNEGYRFIWTFSNMW